MNKNIFYALMMASSVSAMESHPVHHFTVDGEFKKGDFVTNAAGEEIFDENAWASTSDGIPYQNGTYVEKDGTRTEMKKNRADSATSHPRKSCISVH